MNLKIKCILGESVVAGGKTVMRESGKGWSTGEATTATTREAERARRDATGESEGESRERERERDRRWERRADGRPRTGRRRACAVRKGMAMTRGSEDTVRRGIVRERKREGTGWDTRREGAAARRRCVSLLAPANCRGQSALAEKS